MGSLTIEHRRFPDGFQFRTSLFTPGIADGTVAPLQDVGPFFEAPPAGSPSTHCVYSLLFWESPGGITKNPMTTTPVTGDTKAIAWYQHACFPSGGGGGIGINTYAYSVGAHAVLTGTTPIQTVVPSGQWTGGSSVTPSADSTVEIDALDVIGVEPFLQWLAFGAGGAANDLLSIPPNGGGFYIAFYQKKIWTPPWFIDILEKLVERERGPRLPPERGDPSPIDLVRIGQLLRLGAPEESGPVTVDPSAMNPAEARAELARVRAEISRLEGLATALGSRVSGKGRPR
jgi:hypothetical protein